jgi:hypothetical protein
MRNKLLIALFLIGIVVIIGFFLMPGRTWILWHHYRESTPQTRNTWEKLSAYPLYLLCIWAAEDKTKTLYEGLRHNKAQTVLLLDGKVILGGGGGLASNQYSCWPETVDPRR